MNCLRYWAKYVRKGEVKSGCIKKANESDSWILLLDSSFNQNKLGSNFVRPIEPINDSFIHNPSYYKYTLKNKEVLGKEECSFWWSFGLKHFVQRLF